MFALSVNRPRRPDPARSAAGPALDLKLRHDGDVRWSAGGPFPRCYRTETRAWRAGGKRLPAGNSRQIAVRQPKPFDGPTVAVVPLVVSGTAGTVVAITADA